MILGLDPGREKCGLAVLTETGEVIWQAVISTVQLETTLKKVMGKYEFQQLAIGNGTTGKIALQRVKQLFPQLETYIIDEYKTTEAARRNYWLARPPTGWRRLLPTSMQVPPEPVDDFVAILLARRALRQMQGIRAKAKD